MTHLKTWILATLALSATGFLLGSHGCTGDTILIGRAVLPAETFLPGPTSGERLGTAAINGVFAPFVDKQPVQGFSAVADNHDGTFMVMSDNGFGGIENSADFNLRVHHIRP